MQKILENGCLRETIALRFKITGYLRFLSHQETMRVFQRALLRGGFDLQFSNGFNPRPRMTLPLPRSVGIASECDMLCAQVTRSVDSEPINVEDAICRLKEVLPDEIEPVHLELIDGKASFSVDWADYLFPLDLNDSLKEKVLEFANFKSESKPILVKRESFKSKRCKQVDLCDLVDCISLVSGGILVRLNITQEGSARIDEIMSYLGIEQEELSGAIVRTDAGWLRK